MFTGTLRDNLAYLNPDAGLDNAVDQLGLRQLVNRLGGYDTVLNPAALSAGERQLIAAGRAYVAQAPLIILDKATCDLDPATETIVEKAFADRPGTLVVIAHRISSALRARRTLVLDGAAAMVGTHQQLLTHSALYRDLLGHWQGAHPHKRSDPHQPAAS